MPARRASSALRGLLTLTKPPEEHFRDHLRDEAEDSLLERWTKLGEAVLAHGAPTEDHIYEMTALARAEQEKFKLRMRRTMRIYRQGQSKAA
jgi:hypothetical protein